MLRACFKFGRNSWRTHTHTAMWLQAESAVYLEGPDATTRQAGRSKHMMWECWAPLPDHLNSTAVWFPASYLNVCSLPGKLCASLRQLLLWGQTCYTAKTHGKGYFGFVHFAWPSLFNSAWRTRIPAGQRAGCAPEPFSSHRRGQKLLKISVFFLVTNKSWFCSTQRLSTYWTTRRHNQKAVVILINTLRTSQRANKSLSLPGVEPVVQAVVYSVPYLGCPGFSSKVVVREWIALTGAGRGKTTLLAQRKG